METLDTLIKREGNTSFSQSLVMRHKERLTRFLNKYLPLLKHKYEVKAVINEVAYYIEGSKIGKLAYLPQADLIIRCDTGEHVQNAVKWLHKNNLL